MRLKQSTSAVAAALGLSLLVGRADAAVTIVFTQSGGNVVATGSGMLDVTDLTFVEVANALASGVVSATEGSAYIGYTDGSATTAIDVYTGFVGPASFGSGTLVTTEAGAGNLVGVAGATYIITPFEYVSGSPLSATATFEGETFASMGLTPGSYVYTWGSGADADSLTIDVVPESSTWAMFLLGFAGLGAVTYSSCRRAAFAA